MGFNASDFIKSTAKTAAQNIISSTVSKITSNLPIQTKLVATSTAETLFNIGASYESMQALTSKKTDSLISGASDDFFALAGKVTNRTGGASLSKLRRTGSEDINQYLDKINPSTKVRSKKKNNTPEIITVL